MTFLDEHRSFIDRKTFDGKPRYWKIAKQKSQRSTDEIAEILSSFTADDGRALMPYRYLGLVQTPKITSPELTEIGEEFLASDDARRQSILDLQMLKFWLSNPINPRNVGVDIFPAVYVLELLLETEYLTFLEYASIVAWTDSSDKVPEVAAMISDFRASGTAVKQAAFEYCKISSQVDEYSDNVSRLFHLLFAGSYFRELDAATDEIGDVSIALAVTNEVARIYLTKFEELQMISGNDYQEWDVSTPSIDLWDFAYFEKFHGVESQSIEEIIVAEDSDLEIPEETSIPPIEHISPREIQVVLSRSKTPTNTNSSTRVNKPKVDFIKKAIANQASGLRAEEVVVRYEQQKLIKLGKPDLANKVHHLAAESDSQSYDVVSYDVHGNELHVEVKGISKLSRKVSIFFTANEVKRAQIDEHYRLILVFDYWKTEPLVYEAEELLELVKDTLDPSSIYADNATVTPVSWEIIFDVTSR